MAGKSGSGGRTGMSVEGGMNKSPVRGNKSVLHRYANITSTILNHNHGGGDIDEIFINAARDGAYDRLQNLLSSGDGSALVSVNLKDRRTGNTALIWAAKRGHVKIAQLLLRYGADTTLRNYDGQSALEVASPVIKQIIIDCVESSAASATHRLLQAAWIGNSDVVNQILCSQRTLDVDCCNSDGFTPLLLCTRDIYMMEKLGTQLVKNYQPSVVINDLIQCRASTNGCDSEGKTALHYCASSKAAIALNLAALLVNNSHTDTKDRRSLTPLHYACQAGNSGIVKLLVESGSDVNNRGFAGTTPLHVAAYNNHEQAAATLLEYGADSLMKDDSGQSAMDVDPVRQDSARSRKFKTMLKSWQGSAVQKPVELAPVRAPGTPRSRQLSAGKSRVHSSTQLSDPALQKILVPEEESLTRGIQREGTRLLGAPRSGNMRTGTKEILTPISSIKHHHHHHQRSGEHNTLRSHSTSDIGDGTAAAVLKKSRLDSSADRQQRADGVMSVEVLGLGSAEPRRRSSADMFYSRAVPHHDVIISNHGRGPSPNSPVVRLAPLNSSPYNNTTANYSSPVAGGVAAGVERITPSTVYTNLPDILSPSSPLLSTIHEMSSDLPRSVMMDSDILRQNNKSPDKLLHRRGSTSPEDKLLSGDGVGSLLKSEFILDDSRIEEHRSNNIPSTNKRLPQATSQANKQVNKKTDASHKLHAVSKENAAQKKGPNSKEVPNTVASKILTHVVTKENSPKLLHTPSKGKIIVQNSDLLQENSAIAGLNSVTAATPINIPKGVTVPMGVARQKTSINSVEDSKDTTTVFQANVPPSKAQDSPKKVKAVPEKSAETPAANKTQVSKGVTKAMVDRLQNAISANSNQAPKNPTAGVGTSSNISNIAVTKSGNVPKNSTGPKKPVTNAKPTNLNSVTKTNTNTNKTPAGLSKGKQQQSSTIKPTGQTVQNKSATPKVSPRKPMAVAKINTNMSGSTVHSPRRPDKPLTRQVSYGSRSSSSENFKQTHPTRKSSKEKTTLNAQQKADNITRQSSSSSDDFTPANEAIVTPRPKPSNTSPKQPVKTEAKSAVNKVSTNQTFVETSKTASANSGLKSNNANIEKTLNHNANINASHTIKQGEPPIVRQPPNDKDIQWPRSRENVVKTETKQPFMSGARAYQPLHMLMNSSIAGKLKQDETITLQDDRNESMVEESQNHMADNDIPTLTKDQAMTLTFSQQQEIERTAQQLRESVPPLPAEYQGPVIEDIFENFPKPLYEFAVHIAQDMANKKAAQTKKKKKKVTPAKPKADSRSSSGVKAKRTKGTQANTEAGNNIKKRGKSAKKRGAKGKVVSTGTDADPPIIETDNTALISGVGWHISADREADVDYVYNNSDTDGGATTGDDSDGEGLTRNKRRHKRSYSFHEMSPRQRREELKNLLLVMRNTDMGSVAAPHGSATSLLPETMQAIHDFVTAVPNEQELSMLFGLDHQAERNNNRNIHDITEEGIGISDAEDSIPDVSEIELDDHMTDDEAPVMLLDNDSAEQVPRIAKCEGNINTVSEQNSEDTNKADKENSPECQGKEDSNLKPHDGKDHHFQQKLKPHKLPERCVSTAMTDIIDEILNTPRSKSPYTGDHGSPRRRLPDSLVREIHEEWEKASQSTASGGGSTSGSSQNTSMLSTMTSTEASTLASTLASTMTAADSDSSDEESDSDTEESSSEEDESELSCSDTDTEIPLKPQTADKPPIPRLSAASPAPLPARNDLKNHRLIMIEKPNAISTPSSEGTHSSGSGSKKGLMSFSEVDSLPIAFPLLDEKQLTASLKSEIKSRPHSRTVVSRLGGRRPSLNGHDDVGLSASAGNMTQRSTGSDDQYNILTWKKGNILGKGAYGTVFCGLTSDGHLIAVKQIELNVHDWDKAEKEYESIQEEVDLLKTLKHTNIVGFLGTSLDDHVVSIFMQFVPGGTISSLLSRFGAFEERVFQKYTLQIVNGVQYLHDNGVIHRDIKGANIMLMSNGIIKLIDFGCAKRLCLHLSVSQSEVLKSMKGTPYWMAPEVIKETGHGYKSDIWSIGCTVFEMATTKPPWSEMQPMAAIFAIGSNKPIPELPESCGKEAREFVKLCLQRDQSLRKSAKELLQSPFLTNTT